MGKGGFGKGWGNGPYHNQNQWNGGWKNWQYNWQNGFGRSSSSGLGISTMAGNLTNFMGELCAFGKMSRLGSVLSTAYNSQQHSDTSNAGTPATQKNGTAPANDSSKDALLQKLETVVDTMDSKIAPGPCKCARQAHHL